MRRSLKLTALALLAAVVLAACEKPDASYVTSPPMKTMIGTTTGNTAFNPPETAPPTKEPPAGWELDFALARWSELENGDPALEILLEVGTQPGAGFELWVTHEGETVARWWAGSTTKLIGTVCFQLALELEGQAVPLREGPHKATVVFRDPGGEVIAARESTITNDVPKLEGATADGRGEVFREALACRRGT